MTRLLKIEWLKLKHYRPFWVLVGLYGLLSVIVCSSVRLFFKYLRDKGAKFDEFDPTMIPFYDFPDVWQNITYIATNFRLFLAFIIIISVANEVRNRTLRQNIIDGMSKKEWLGSKLLLIGALSLAATFLLFVVGLLMGLIYSHPDGYSNIFQSMDFLVAYGLEVFTFMTFALLITLVIKRPGIVIVCLMMYSIAFEPILTLILANAPNLPDFCRTIAGLFPITALNNLIHIPFQKYVLQSTQDYVSTKEFLIVLAWLVFNIWMSYWILRKRDL